jgi:hypothetical protein
LNWTRKEGPRASEAALDLPYVKVIGK